MEIVEEKIVNGSIEIVVTAKRGETVTLPKLPYGKVTIVEDNTF